MVAQWYQVYLPCRRTFDPWVGKIPWRRKWQYSCLGNLMDRGVWPTTAHGGHKELDMTE